MSNPYTVLNKVTLFVVQDYLTNSLADGGQIPHKMKKLNGAITGYKKFHMFSAEEATIVIDVSKDPEIKEILARELSYVVFAMELMKQWIEDVPKRHRPHLNMSDKHFKLGGGHFWAEMLKLKQHNKGNYKHKMHVIDDSREIAQKFYEFHKRRLV